MRKIRNLMKHVLLVLVSFVFFMELPAWLGIESERLVSSRMPLEESVEAIAVLKASGVPVACFLGDSFAATDYAEDGYPHQFKEYFEDRGIAFVDLSRNGSEIDYHYKVLKAIEDYQLDCVIYFYNFADVKRLHLIGKEEVQSSDPVKKSSLKQFQEWLGKRSRTMTLGRDLIQLSFRIFTGRPFPGSITSNFPAQNSRNIDFLATLFNEINAKHVIVVVNTPFFYDERMKEWEQYDAFKKISLNENVKLLQTVDVVAESDSSVSWRNPHPNQETIDLVSEQVMEVLSDELGSKSF